MHYSGHLENVIDNNPRRNQGDDLCYDEELIRHSMPPEDLGFKDPQVLGLGSLIGADFKFGPSMEAAASELFMLKGATPGYLPIAGIDADWRLVEGEILPGTVPVCITYELMLVNF